MPFDPNPINAEQLRESIQLAGATDTIFLADGATYDSVTTLAKIVCGLPTTREYGYTISASNATVLDTRLFQQNIDGDLPAGQYTGGAENFTLSYSSGGASDGGALLRANFADYTIDGVTFTGEHSGWTGNSGLYMSLTTFNYAAPIDVDLTFSNSLINITGQGSFDPTLFFDDEGGSAFLHSWNNAGTVTLDANVFDESGYRSSFNFTNFSAPNPGPPTVGTYNIIGNTFTRTDHIDVVRSEGNRLGNVKATLTNNTFNNGSYLDLYNDISGVSFAGGENYFTSVANGYGIRATGPNTGTVTLEDGASLAFDGDGLALKYVSDVTGSFMLSTVGIGAGLTINGESYDVAAAGSQVADTINTISGGRLWAHGDSGDDTITGSNGADYLDGGYDNDVLTTGFGADTLIGGFGNDILSGGGDADRLEGGTGNDSLNGGGGADRLLGDIGFDTLQGGTGNDTLTGGDGSDQFRWASGDGTDEITDFTATGVGVDQMALIDIFASTNPGNTLDSGDFTTATGIGAMTNPNNNNKVTKITAGITNISTTASGANVAGYVLAYNNTTLRGELWYDTNWNNSGNRTQVATFDNVQSFATLDTFTNANFFAYSA
jgi:Ca2+-binding RTX toxin-like protein